MIQRFLQFQNLVHVITLSLLRSPAICHCRTLAMRPEAARQPEMWRQGLGCLCSHGPFKNPIAVHQQMLQS